MKVGTIEVQDDCKGNAPEVANILRGSGPPPDPTNLPDGTLYIQLP